MHGCLSPVSPVAPPDAVAAAPPAPVRGSLAALLTGLRALYPPALLSGAGWDRLLAGCGALPAVVAGYMGFEFRLGRAEPAADLCAALYPGGPLAAHLAARGRAAPRGSPEALLGSFAAAFTAREAPWARRTWLALLEYDLARAVSPAPALPGVFLSFREPPRSRAEGRVADLADVVAEGLPAAVGLPAFPEARRGVERVLGALRGRAHVINAGVFRGRPARTLRVVVADLGVSDVTDLLGSLSWRGPLAAVRGLLAEFGPACTGVGLSVDVAGAGIGPRAGVELFAGPPGGAWAAGSRRDWEPLVDRLVARRLCSPAKASGLLAWTGRQRVFTAAGVRIACRGVNHVKVSFGAGPPSAKAYAGLALLPPKAGPGSSAGAAPALSVSGASGRGSSPNGPV